LEKHSSQTRLFSKIVRQSWFRPIAKLIERITTPGILLHYALRKKCINGLVRSALADGVAQIVVIGAGFDSLSSELRGVSNCAILGDRSSSDAASQSARLFRNRN
jgi:O-methyltransferase involved in polyketide biosynthesis